MTENPEVAEKTENIRTELSAFKQIGIADTNKASLVKGIVFCHFFESEHINSVAYEAYA